MSLRSPNSELSLRSPSIPTRRLSRVSSTDQASAPFEEVRRRLASINGSTSSLNLAASPREPKIPLIPTPYSGPNLSTLERPQSPTESVVSTSNSAAFKPTNLLYTGGTDAQKAAPAVGSSKANALGVLDAHSRILPDAEMSGRSTSSGSPLPVRPSHPSRLSTMPISSYGMYVPCLRMIKHLAHRGCLLTPDGKEAGINAVIENLYLHSSREYQDDFGPKVHDGPIRRRNPVRQSLIPRDGSPRKLEATLVAHLASHNDCITGLAVSPDHLFFVSCSDDKTVKVWDTARLERNVTSKPRHTYGQHHARVKAVCVLESVHCFASAAEDGSLHVVRVDVSQSGTLPKYGKLQVIREHRLENPGEYITCMYHYNTGAYSVDVSFRMLTCPQRLCVESGVYDDTFAYRRSGSPHDGYSSSHGEPSSPRPNHHSVCRPQTLVDHRRHLRWSSQHVGSSLRLAASQLARRDYKQRTVGPSSSVCCSSHEGERQMGHGHFRSVRFRLINADFGRSLGYREGYSDRTLRHQESGIQRRATGRPGSDDLGGSGDKHLVCHRGVSPLSAGSRGISQPASAWPYPARNFYSSTDSSRCCCRC